jgi:hypothetical protein
MLILLSALLSTLGSMFCSRAALGLEVAGPAFSLSHYSRAIGTLS